MIVGKVFNRQALLPVIFRLPGFPDLEIEFVVDTGFAGFLTLPPIAVQKMGLVYQHHTPAGLADDSHVQIPVYEAVILWNGVERSVRVLAMGKRPSLGTSLMNEMELTVVFREGAQVTIRSA